MSWLLLLHQIPPSPSYLRAKILRKLNNLGVVPIKNSAYILPETAETLEDLEWIRSEIVNEGGEAWLFAVRTVGGLSDESIRESFRNIRAPDFKQLLESLADIQTSVAGPEEQIESVLPALRKLKRKLDDLTKIDYFRAPYREEVESTLMKIEETIAAALRPAVPATAAKPGIHDLVGCTWVTRRGVKVDRIATAWLIRNFIDSTARFSFVDQRDHLHVTGEIRFDMFEGEFTHEAGLCTFEALLRHAGLNDPGLQAIAEIVHDIDLKDDRFQRPETKGLSALIDGIAAMHEEDARRVEEGSRLLDALYAAFRGNSRRENR